MKPLARVAIPHFAGEIIVETIATRLMDSFSFFEIDFDLQPDITHPKALSFERNGADLGSIDGNPDASSIALFGAIHNDVNWVFQEEHAKELR